MRPLRDLEAALRECDEFGRDVEYELTLREGGCDDGLLPADGDEGRSMPLPIQTQPQTRTRRGVSLSAGAGDVLVSARASRPCVVWASVDADYKRPCLPDRNVGELLPELGDVAMFLNLGAVVYDRIVFVPEVPPGVDEGEPLTVTAVLRVTADEDARKRAMITTTPVRLLGGSFETRGGFLFPVEWKPERFIGLGHEFRGNLF